MEQRVREARPADASAIADVHVEAWRETYDGIMDPAFLDGLRSADRPELWADRLELWDRVLREANEQGACVYVAEQECVIGFANAGPAREAEGADAEIYAIYLRQRAWGQGHGRALLAACLGHMRRQEPRGILLWVLEQNAGAQRFYQAAGFIDDGGRKTLSVGGRELDHVCYSMVLAGGRSG